jgi:hypothetical protein
MIIACLKMTRIVMLLSQQVGSLEDVDSQRKADQLEVWMIRRGLKDRLRPIQGFSMITLGIEER